MKLSREMLPTRRARVLSHRMRLGLLAGLLALGSTLPVSHMGTVHAAADKDTLAIGWPISPQNFDPPNAPDNPSIWVLVNIYDPLLRPGNDGTSLNPDLATSWNISKDGKVYTFHIRPNVLFHDGSKVTASDVKFSLDRARDPKQAWSYLYTEIQAIAAPDPLTVKITLKYAWAPFLSDMAFFAGGIYPEAYFKKVGVSGLATHPIGSGPYQFVSFKPGQQTVITRNEKYWAANQFPMKRVEFDVVPNDTTRLLQVQSGDIDVDNVLAPNLVAQLKSSPSAQPMTYPSTAVKYLQPNHLIAPFKDLKVRQAINHAIDRASLIKAVYYGFGTPANSFLAKGTIGYDANIPVPTFDLALAKKLLSQSSVPHGFSMTYETRAGDVQDNQIAVIFQRQMQPLGITVNIKPTDPTALAELNQTYKFNFFSQYWTNDIPDPDELVSYSVDPKIVNAYYTHYNNPMLANLSRQAESSSDQNTRLKLYNKIQEIFAQEVPFFYIADLPLIDGVNNHVKGFKQNPLGYFALQGVTKS